MEYELCIYRFDDNELEIMVSLSEETIWLSLGDMAALFDRDRSVIGKHVKNVLSEWLGKTPVWAKIARTGPDGKRYDVDCYNLDVVVSVGNRIKSKNTLAKRATPESKLFYKARGFSEVQPGILERDLD